MRTWLSAAVAAMVLIFAMAGVASAAPGSNGNGNSKGKGSLPPIDMSNAANCDFIAEPGNALCLLPFPDDYYTRPDSSSPTGRRVDQPHRAAEVHGPLALGAATGPGSRREHDRVGAVDRRRDVIVALEVADDRLDPRLLEVGGLGGVANEAADPIAPLGQHRPEREADLPVSTGDRHIHLGPA